MIHDPWHLDFSNTSILRERTIKHACVENGDRNGKYNLIPEGEECSLG